MQVLSFSPWKTTVSGAIGTKPSGSDSHQRWHNIKLSQYSTASCKMWNCGAVSACRQLGTFFFCFRFVADFCTGPGAISIP